MINFTAKEVKRLSEFEFNIERGFMGSEESEESVGFYFPSPSYEYSIVIYNSKEIPYEKSSFPDLLNPLSKEGKEELAGLGKARLNLSFIGYERSKSLKWLGLEGIQILEAHQKDSSLIFSPEKDSTTGLFDEVIKAHKNKLVKVTQYYESTYRYPWTNVSLIWNLNGNWIAGYGTRYTDRTILIYAILPQFKDNIEMLIGLFPALIELIQT